MIQCHMCRRWFRWIYNCLLIPEHRFGDERCAGSGKGER